MTGQQNKTRTPVFLTPSQNGTMRPFPSFLGRLSMRACVLCPIRKDVRLCVVGAKVLVRLAVQDSDGVVSRQNGRGGRGKAQLRGYTGVSQVSQHRNTQTQTRLPIRASKAVRLPGSTGLPVHGSSGRSTNIWNALNGEIGSIIKDRQGCRLNIQWSETAPLSSHVSRWMWTVALAAKSCQDQALDLTMKFESSSESERSSSPGPVIPETR
ncbi:hypothetical protein B0T10DRAFT_452574 [Thelonectria olida]|uniref:Uncharacterized protein n=1 Tax=Thelonectria olida TaxID=1576542 RepID=A0A9P8WID4_9HYPO|nr:hypothetical protein B0T10DRAFT_452574 [Thelonectria olida]